MFTKKQFLTLLTVAVFVFIIVTSGCYWLAYQKGLSAPIVNPDAVIETFETEEPISEVEVKDNSRILPTTKVQAKILDQEGYIIEEKYLDTLSLLSKTMEEVGALFEDYKIEKFTPEEVILTRQMYIAKEAPSFSLGIEKGEIGILVGGSTPSFIQLGLSTRDFSAWTVELLSREHIHITVEQKRKLEKDAYYIEEILQNYSE
ncbi:MAG: hypothetical protein RR776_09545 [Niameybacter sp.]|uniref:hypothetical protein n=1 Tax=Niameybacter sp. TaxID=2033640 RepID=UPI002FC90BB6